MTTSDSEWEVGEDSVLGMSCSEENGSANDLPSDQPQPSPEARFGFGMVFGEVLGEEEPHVLWMVLFHCMILPP